jgi:hypothetical protein
MKLIERRKNWNEKEKKIKKKITEAAHKQRREIEENERKVKEEALFRKQEILRAQEEKKKKNAWNARTTYSFERRIQ